jgi:hypothetical protein
VLFTKYIENAVVYATAFFFIPDSAISKSVPYIPRFYS